jgi:hypothetical protein
MYEWKFLYLDFKDEVICLLQVMESPYSIYIIVYNIIIKKKCHVTLN